MSFSRSVGARARQGALVVGFVAGVSSCGATSALDGPPGALTTGLTCTLGEPYAGALCGVSAPCVVLADASFATVSQANDPEFLFLSFGADQTASLALDGTCVPHVLTVTEGTGALFSSPEASGAWSTSATPMPSYAGALAYDVAGDACGLATDGNNGSSIWKLGAGAWTELTAVPGMVGVSDQAFGIDTKGGLHALLWQQDLSYSDALYDGSWTIGPSTSTSVLSPALAVSSTGADHAAYWEWLPAADAPSVGGFSWWQPPDAPERIATSTGEPPFVTTSIATSAPTAENPAGRPQILFGIPSPSRAVTVTYATRTGPGQWTTTTIDEGQLDLPIGIAVSANGDARFFYTTAPSCSGSSCDADIAAGARDLHVAFLDGATVTSTVLATVWNASVATLAVDSAGDIHLAFLEAKATATSTDYSTRYLLVGSAR